MGERECTDSLHLTRLGPHQPFITQASNQETEYLLPHGCINKLSSQSGNESSLEVKRGQSP